MEVQSTKIVDALKAGFTDGFGQVKASLEESVAARATRAQWTPAQTTVLFNCYKESGITTSKHLSKKVLGEKYKTLTDAVNQELGGAHYTVTQVQWKLKDATKVYKKLKADAEALGGGYDSDESEESAAERLDSSSSSAAPLCCWLHCPHMSLAAQAADVRRLRAPPHTQRRVGEGA